MNLIVLFAFFSSIATENSTLYQNNIRFTNKMMHGWGGGGGGGGGIQRGFHGFH